MIDCPWILLCVHAGWTDVGGRWRAFRAMVQTGVVPTVEVGKL